MNIVQDSVNASKFVSLIIKSNGYDVVKRGCIELHI